MQASTFHFTAKDGVEIHVYKWSPDGVVRGAVQIVHGMAEHAARYAHVAEALISKGYAVYANDHRGHGKTAKTEAEVGHFADENGWDKVLDDLHQLNGIIRKENPGVPVVVFGHSMGSFFVQTLLFTYPDDADAVIMSGTNGRVGLLASAGAVAAAIEQARLGKRGKSKLLDSMSFGAYNNAFKPTRTKFDWLSRDPVNVDKYIADPRCGFLVSTQLWRDLLGGLQRNENPANRAKVKKDLPVYIFAGAKDPVSNATKNLHELINGYKSVGLKRVEHKIYDDGRHEMVNETNRDEVIRDVVAWLERTFPSA